jgi:hypothetical protein
MQNIQTLVIADSLKKNLNVYPYTIICEVNDPQVGPFFISGVAFVVDHKVILQ